MRKREKALFCLNYFLVAADLFLLPSASHPLLLFELLRPAGLLLCGSFPLPAALDRRWRLTPTPYSLKNVCFKGVNKSAIPAITVMQ